AGPDCLLRRLAAAHDTARRTFARAELLVGDDADRRLRLLLHLRLAPGGAAPAGEHEAAVTLDDLAQPCVLDDAAVRVALPPLGRGGEQRALVIVQPAADRHEGDALVHRLLARDVGDHVRAHD